MFTLNSKKINLYFLAYLPAILWASLIFFLSNQPTLPSFSLSLYDFIFKKSAHIFVYAVLYLLLFYAYYQSHQQKLSKKNYYIPLLICLTYSISDELHQALIPGRYPTARDIGFDMLGVSSMLLYQQKLI